MFLNRNKKNNVYPCKPQFYCIKVGLRRSKLYRYVFVMESQNTYGVWTESQNTYGVWTENLNTYGVSTEN